MNKTAGVRGVLHRGARRLSDTVSPAVLCRAVLELLLRSRFMAATKIIINQLKFVYYVEDNLWVQLAV